MGKYKHILLYFYNTFPFFFLIYKLFVSCLLRSSSTSLTSYQARHIGWPLPLPNFGWLPLLKPHHSIITHNILKTHFLFTWHSWKRKEIKMRKTGLQRQRYLRWFEYTHTHTHPPVNSHYYPVFALLFVSGKQNSTSQAQSVRIVSPWSVWKPKQRSQCVYVCVCVCTTHITSDTFPTLEE